MALRVNSNIRKILFKMAFYKRSSPSVRSFEAIGLSILEILMRTPKPNPTIHSRQTDIQKILKERGLKIRFQKSFSTCVLLSECWTKHQRTACLKEGKNREKAWIPVYIDNLSCCRMNLLSKISKYPYQSFLP